MFAHTRASAVAPPSTKALPVSVRRNSRSAVRLCQTVSPENSDPDSADDGSLTTLTPIVDHCPGRVLTIHDRRLGGRDAHGPDVSERGRDARGTGALHDRGGAAHRRAPHRAALPLLLGP